MLRDPEKFSDEEWVLIGMNALQTLKIHKSSGLVKRLMKTLINCGPLLEGNLEFRHAAEQLLLKLLATNIPQLKILVYKLVIDGIKNFFSGFSDGVANVRSSFKMERSEGYFIGIPINENILTEIICFGLKSEVQEVVICSEMILTYLVKGQPILGKHWKKLLKLLSPLLPLLQTNVDPESVLGKGIFNLMDPDLGIDKLECLRGNMRYLFALNPTIREETLLRILFMVSNHTQLSHYLPNLEHIKDTINNNICIIGTKIPLRSALKSGVYDLQTLRDLIQLLQCQDALPKVRYSTLIQLNAIVDDPAMCDAMYNQNFWPYILQALDNAMKTNHTRDYPDSAIPALQIICKLCIRSGDLRRNISCDLDFNFLLMRALFMHHHNQDFKKDAATLIFILSHCDFALGTEEVSFPYAFSELCIPFECDFHYTTSPFYEANPLEEIIFEENDEAYDDLFIMIDDNTSPTRKYKVQSECGVSQLREAELDRNLRKNQQKEASMQKEYWKYLRIMFTNLWFEEMRYIMENIEQNASSKVN